MSRYSVVMKNATFLRSNRDAMNAHLRKSKLCANKICANKLCSFYHTKDDYKPPVCIYEEFCRKDYCTMFHPTKESFDEFIKRNNIIFPKIDARRDEVMERAKLLRADRNAMNEHLRKSKPCTNTACLKTDCGFAHSLDDFRAPVCIYEEFCESATCTMFHPNRQTLDEYISIHNITFKTVDSDTQSQHSQSHSQHSQHSQHAKPYPNGAFTKMCNLMTHNEPCPRDWCTFAHSIYDLRFSDELVCYDYHNENEKQEACEKFHPNQCKCCPHDAIGRRDGQVCQELLQFVISLGYTIEPFMTRHPSDNRSCYVKIYDAQNKFIEDMQQLEEMESTVSEIEVNDPAFSITMSMSALSVDN